MTSEHGATTIKQWMEDLVELARSGATFATGAGANPGRDYAYLEFHPSEDEHSILVFRVESEDGQPFVRTYRFDGPSSEVRDQVDALVHGR